MVVFKAMGDSCCDRADDTTLGAIVLDDPWSREERLPGESFAVGIRISAKSLELAYSAIPKSLGNGMTRVWFNKAFSSVAESIALIRGEDKTGEYCILGSNTKPYSPVYIESHESFVEPAGLTSDEYLDWCLQECVTREVGIFVPGKEASAIAGASQAFEAVGTRVMCASSQQVIGFLHDKQQFYAHVDSPQAPPPEFAAFESLAQFDAAYGKLRQRHEMLCVKPTVSVYGLGFAAIDEQRSTAQLLLDGAQGRIGYEDFRRGLSALTVIKPMLLMEYLPGNEFSVDCIADHGIIKCAVARRKSPIAGQGQTIDARTDIQQSVAGLARNYALNGFFNVQFREAVDGLKLLEINPRMSGGIAMSCLAGPNLPYLALVGFDKGYTGLEIPAVRFDIQVAQAPRALELRPINGRQPG